MLERQAQGMKRIYIYLVAILLVIGAFYFWNHRRDYSFIRQWLPTRPAEGVIQTGQGEQLEWRPIDQANLGFRLEMPGDPKRISVQANTEAGTNEPINMLIVKSEGGGSYAIAWADKPPVARMNDLNPDKTLDQARDGALTRTGTTLVTENRNSPQGFTGRDIVAHNVGGGILDSRFVYAGPRLYMLIATSPSPTARHLEDVNHFFDSFTVAGNTQIPETLPAATQ